MDRKTYHIISDKKDSWRCEVEGESKALFKTDKKEDAVQKALKLAEANQPSEVKIHTKQGKVEGERRFGE